MQSIELYTYAGCSSCKQAEALLRTAEIAIVKRDIFAAKLSAAEFKVLFARLGVEPNDLLATRSRPFRELNLSERATSTDEIINLIAIHPALLRRPLVVAGNLYHVGFNRAGLESLLATMQVEKQDYA